MGKGAGSCGARGAMSLQGVGNPITATGEHSSAMHKKALKQAERDARYLDGVRILSRQALEFCYWDDKEIHHLDEFCDEINAVTAKERQVASDAVEYLATEGWATMREYVPTITEGVNKHLGKATVDFKITPAEETKFDHINDGDDIITQRQDAYRLRDGAKQAISELAASSTYAPQVFDYLASEDPYSPNQAHFAEELGYTSTEISRAVQELQGSSLMDKVEGKNNNGYPSFKTTPTYYKLTPLGIATRELMQEQAAASPSMAALMAEDD